MISTIDSRAAAEPAAAPDARITAYVFERIFGHGPGRVRHVPGTLTLLNSGPAHTGRANAGRALTVAIPWGAIVALGAGPLDLYSMNHHADRHTEGVPPGWAVPALAALHAHGVYAAQMVVNRELPVETGLPNGAETFCAVSQALQDLHGLPALREADGDRPAYMTALHAQRGKALIVNGIGPVEHVPCDLVAAGLRFLIIEAGVRGSVPAARCHRLLVDTAAAALRARDLNSFGTLLDRGHVRGQRALDLALDSAREAGALGGLVVGRCAVALVPVTAVHRVRKSVKASLAGLARRPPRFLTAVPAGR
ncbi:galactokinase [Actinomadura vinacea]|uniref:Galactokinase n=1 Tax=Actinomadura vinacea TaxID=115336 RepID=A0ABN3IV62_9ACTN